MGSRQIQIPAKILRAAKKWQRFLVLHGGRGGAKSESIARILVYEGAQRKHRILCCREYQNSIADSVHSVLGNAITELEIQGYKITDKYIRHGNGTEFIFKGLKKESVGSIKSLHGVTICWVEEAQYISAKSLGILTPTIREKNSKIVFSLNIETGDEPVTKDFINVVRDDTVVCNVSYWDNPWFPEVLRKEMEYDKATDYEMYLHRWEGEPIRHSDDQVFFGKWEVLDFETTEKTDFLQGIDWGFANDPLAGVRSYIETKDDGDYLFIDREAYQIKVEIPQTAEYLLSCIPTIKDIPAAADNARPEMISYLRAQGFKIRESIKGHGSVKDGIEKIRGFRKIYIHPRCKNTINEFRNYKWKKNRLTGENTNVPEDKNNHIIDALRYSLEKYGRKVKTIRY